LLNHRSNPSTTPRGHYIETARARSSQIYRLFHSGSATKIVNGPNHLIPLMF
jgi:hypothetical protein